MAAEPVVTINLFTVDPVHQGELIEILTEVTDAYVRHAPGFVSATLHRSLDGAMVTMYAEWQSKEAYEQMRKDPAPVPYFERALAISTFSPGMYEVTASFFPAISPPANLAIAG